MYFFYVAHFSIPEKVRAYFAKEKPSQQETVLCF
jgi:hypothetical protein